MTSGSAHETMRAITIPRPGGPEVLTLAARPLPPPGPGEIRVRVHASALNRADLLQRRGSYPAPPGAVPDIPGLEYAGEVEALGEGVELWSRGDRVMGIIGGGGHAEFVCVDQGEAIPIPEKLSWEKAAAIPEAFLTAYDALIVRLDCRMGESVLIHAVGSGVGTAALQLAGVVGAPTFGTSRSAAKLTAARELGLGVAIDASAGEWSEAVERETEGLGVDLVLDLVGGSYLDGNVRVLAQQGRMVCLGTLGGARAELDLGLLLRKRLQIQGSVLRTRSLPEKVSLARDFAEHVVPLFESGRLHPVLDRIYPFEEIAEAHRQLEENRSFGKLVLRW